MLQWDAPNYFYFLLLIPLMMMGYSFLLVWKRNAKKRFGSPVLLEALAPRHSAFKTHLKFGVLLLGISALILAMVNPKMGTELETVKREGVDLVFAVDVSKSMLAEDIAPNRLEKAKRLVSETINKLSGDRVGIIAYAASAVPQLPITTDYESAKMFLQALNTNMLSSQGTAIAEAIELSKTYFDNENQTNRVLCIFSDGEDHEEGGELAAKTAAEEGITIFTVALGTEKGDVIPIKRNGVTSTFKKDAEGEVVITRMNTTILKEVAENTNGIFLLGDNTSEVVAAITNRLLEMDKAEFEAKQFVRFKDQYQWLLAIGLFLICLDLFLLDRKTKWIRNLNLFNDK
ncbi:MAG: VWA domain-containing protein [Flavobacteriaceae bacterium]|jgi:Ca-activated chloride channel family protein|nr:VWA domain-containing protein [Flavobacteriaceae bacterium]MBT7458953.1 VWA domain-containing protein [Flavobacteriaceae bacterium]MDG0967091.1 VWA domain-containing protein [Flavobacteriaceae bacterium]